VTSIMAHAAASAAQRLSSNADFVSYFAKIGAEPEGRSDQTIAVVAAFALELLWP
jgi:hypothetical protein